MTPETLNNASQAGLYFLLTDSAGKLLEQLSDCEVIAFRADLKSCRLAAEALDELGSAFQLPVWYGANLDALHDCLADPEWQNRQTTVLVLDGLETLAHLEPEFSSTLIEVLASAAENRSLAGAPLWVLLTDPIAGVLPFLG